MNQHLIFLPFLAQVLLTMLVWLWMYKTRISEMIKLKISAQQLADSTKAVKLLKDVAGPSENLINLFEVPVLFYAAILTLYTTGLVSDLYLVLTTGYVVLRYIHSFIHITYNRVLHRFSVYVASTILLWVVWILIGIDIIQYKI